MYYLERDSKDDIGRHLNCTIEVNGSWSFVRDESLYSLLLFNWFRFILI